MPYSLDSGSIKHLTFDEAARHERVDHKLSLGFRVKELGFRLQVLGLEFICILRVQGLGCREGARVYGVAIELREVWVGWGPPPDWGTST